MHAQDLYGTELQANSPTMKNAQPVHKRGSAQRSTGASRCQHHLSYLKQCMGKPNWSSSNKGRDIHGGEQQ